jgi:hypothetical protein
MWTTVFVIVFIIMLTLILHDMGKILKIQDELIKEQYLMRGELNAILDISSFVPKMFSGEPFSGELFSGEPFSGEPFSGEKDTTTVEIKPE